MVRGGCLRAPCNVPACAERGKRQTGAATLHEIRVGDDHHGRMPSVTIEFGGRRYAYAIGGNSSRHVGIGTVDRVSGLQNGIRALPGEVNTQPWRRGEVELHE